MVGLLDWKYGFHDQMRNLGMMDDHLAGLYEALRGR